MPRKGASYCPKCEQFGTTVDPISDGATFVVVRCNDPKCGHVWKSRSKSELKWARIKAQKTNAAAAAN